MEKKGSEVAVLAGGCFWCMEAIFKEINGVLSVQSGYSGGTLPDPTYEEVCTGKTGHAESVMITFDPQVISYTDILEIFFSTHDPTTLNRQGNDVGTQYRSVIFYMDDGQKIQAAGMIKNLENEGRFRKPVVTRVEKFQNFYPAEDYHKDYFSNNPDSPYCMFVIAPKVEKFRKSFAPVIRKE